MYQQNKNIYICSVSFQKDIILNSYFDYFEQVRWLYYFSKILLSTSLPNFKEIFYYN